MKVHVILNSHLDPVWLWKRSQGLDEVLNSARVACNVLERFPETFITRGEVWFYEMVEKCDPELFKRIRGHIDSGRWEVVGNWYVQPDCNLPTADIFRKHNEAGMDYFKKHLGVEVKTGVNVDSFGHAATLPDFYNEAGIRQYVMMRPRDMEKKLPARNFIWESPNGGRLQTFRLWWSYGFSANAEKGVWSCAEHADQEIGHTMLFLGFGDHGGGPLLNEVEWIRQHPVYDGDIQVEFSTTERYFEAVRQSGRELPVVRDELQYHAIGCYSAVHQVKKAVRDAASLLMQAERFQQREPELFESAAHERRTEMWKEVLFASFHDILAGTSIPSAYVDVFRDLGGAAGLATRQIELAIRRKNAGLDPYPVQRMIFDNLSAHPWKGIIHCEPWIAWERYKKDYQLAVCTLDGREIPVQKVPAEVPSAAHPAIAFPLEVPANGRCLLALPFRESASCVGSVQKNGKNGLRNGTSAIRWGKRGLYSCCFSGVEFLKGAIQFQVLKDVSDTWSHRKSYFNGKKKAVLQIADTGWNCDFCGPLTAQFSCRYTGKDADIRLAVILHHGEPEVILKLKIQWHTAERLLRMNIRPAFTAAARHDGIPGGVLRRQLHDQEYPVTGFSAVSAEDGRTFAMVSKDVTSLSVRRDGTMQLTLLRSPYYASDTSWEFDRKTPYGVTDQGEHEFTIRLLGLERYCQKEIDSCLGRLDTDALHFSETTVGFENPFQLPGQRDPDFKKDFLKELKYHHLL